MHNRIVLTLALCALAATTVQAEKKHVDCSKHSLASVVEDADKADTITFTGTCLGPIVVRTDGLGLEGVGAAVIDGRSQNALTVNGAQRVTLTNFEVRNGLNGVLVNNGAHATITGVTLRNNILSGVSLTGGSGATLSQITASNNGLHGLDAVTGSSATLTGNFTASSNRVFGINVNGSSLTFSRATVTVGGNAIGIQVATAGNAFIDNSATVLNCNGNQAVGLTIVSGAHMVAFGGTINANNNGVNGVSVNSKAGLDLDAGAVLNVSGSGGNGVAIQQQSVMTVFNTPQFSGVPGFSTINSTNNTRNGVAVLSGSTLTLSNQAKVVATGNTMNGLLADNGGAMTLVNSVATGNLNRDLLLTFGARADLPSLTLGTWSCDDKVIVRGSGVTCPH